MRGWSNAAVACGKVMELLAVDGECGEGEMPRLMEVS